MPGGRNEIEIDWKKVDQLLVAGASGIEIAAELGIHYDTLYDRTKKKFNISFSDYSAKMYSKGNAMLKAVRFNKALQGNIQTILYLSQTRLKEKINENEELTIKLIDARNNNPEEIQMPEISE